MRLWASEQGCHQRGLGVCGRWRQKGQASSRAEGSAGVRRRRQGASEQGGSSAGGGSGRARASGRVRGDAVPGEPCGSAVVKAGGERAGGSGGRGCAAQSERQTCRPHRFCVIRKCIHKLSQILSCKQALLHVSACKLNPDPFGCVQHRNVQHVTALAPHLVINRAIAVGVRCLEHGADVHVCYTHVLKRALDWGTPGGQGQAGGWMSGQQVAYKFQLCCAKYLTLAAESAECFDPRLPLFDYRVKRAPLLGLTGPERPTCRHPP